MLTALLLTLFVPAQYELHDLLPSYFTYRATTSADPNAKTFMNTLVKPNREVFEAVAFGWLQDDNPTRFLHLMEGNDAKFRHVENRFQNRFAIAWKRFKANTPDANADVAVYLLPAPRNAVGGSVRPLKNTSAIIFGAEELAGVIDSKEAFEVLVQHELTHLYHMQVNPEMRQMVKQVYMPPFSEGAAKLYQVMWLEGLAVYRSKLLNPRASDLEIVLSGSVAQELQTQWPNVGVNLRKSLDSTKTADINKYLFDAPNTESIPRRTGYYVGMLIAKHLSTKYSFAEMCRLKGGTLRKEVGSSLDFLIKRGLHS